MIESASRRRPQRALVIEQQIVDEGSLITSRYMDVAVGEAHAALRDLHARDAIVRTAPDSPSCIRGESVDSPRILTRSGLIAGKGRIGGRWLRGIETANTFVRGDPVFAVLRFD